MRADLGALLHHDDGFVRRELLEPDRGSKSGRPGADNDHVEFHRLAGAEAPAVFMACSVSRTYMIRNGDCFTKHSAQ